MSDEEDKIDPLEEAKKAYQKQARRQGIIMGASSAHPPVSVSRGGLIHALPPQPATDADISRAFLEKAATLLDPDNDEYLTVTWNERLTRAQAYQRQASTYALLDQTAAQRETALPPPEWVTIGKATEGEQEQ